MTIRNVLATLAVAVALVTSALAADIAGKWAAEFDTQIGSQKYTYEFKIDAGKLTGTAAGPQGSVAIQEGKLNGDDVSFVENMTYQGMDIRIEYSGKIASDELRLTRKVGEFATEELVAKRVK
jgi:hypothetical protein